MIKPLSNYAQAKKLKVMLYSKGLWSCARIPR